MVKEELVNRNK